MASPTTDLRPHGPGQRLDAGHRPGHRRRAGRGGCGGDDQRPLAGARGGGRGRAARRASGGNLGIFAPTPLFEIDDDNWQRFWEVNVMSGVRLTRHYAAGMRDRGWGRVQFLASDSAVVIPVEMVHYGVTKTALLGVSRGFAKTLAGSGVTVNAVIAGPTHTEGVEEFVRELVGDDLPWDEAQRTFVREHRPTSLIGRLIEPEEIAALCVYLASDAASATTGGALRVDGGFVDNIVL